MSHELLAELANRDADIDALAARVVGQPEEIPTLLAGLRQPRARPRYGCEKLLRRVSELAPELVYPFFEEIAGHLEDPNSFLKWGAILTLSNLAKVDAERRFDGLFGRYFGPLYGPQMITAANIVGSAARIARGRPELAHRIVGLLLQVDTGQYVHHGEVSEECRRVVCGHAIDALEAMVDLIDDREAVEGFVRGQLESPRAQLRAKAKRFLRRHTSVY